MDGLAPGEEGIERGQQVVAPSRSQAANGADQNLVGAPIRMVANRRQDHFEGRASAFFRVDQRLKRVQRRRPLFDQRASAELDFDKTVFSAADFDDGVAFPLLLVPVMGDVAEERYLTPSTRTAPALSNLKARIRSAMRFR